MKKSVFLQTLSPGLRLLFSMVSWDKSTVDPGFRALGLSKATSALNPGSTLFPSLDLVYFEP